MASSKASFVAFLLILFFVAFQCSADVNQTSTLVVDVGSTEKPIPKKILGVFFEVNATCKIWGHLYMIIYIVPETWP